MNAVNLEYPFGQVDLQTPASAAALNITVKNAVTHVVLSNAMAADMTLNVTITSGVRNGSKLILQAASDGTARQILGGTNTAQAAVAGVISKTKVLIYELINGVFTLLSSNQIN